MKYMGSKNRLSKELAPIIQSYVDKGCKGYLEPFVGGANMIDKIKCDNKYGSDVNKYLIELLEKVRDDSINLPQEITNDEYKNVMNNKGGYENWYVGFVGFLCSFGSKFFGGYARGKNNYGEPRNYAMESYKNLNKQAPSLKNIEFYCNDYKNFKYKKFNNCVIYLDPPYNNTKKYAKQCIDYNEFYDFCEKLAKNNIVLISEYSMPSDRFECIWKKEVKVLQKSDRTKGDKAIEKLFICKSK